jgi:dihydrofolate reductase
MARLSLIVAMAENRVIGACGALPWHLSSDLKRFRALTMGHHIIMGRKTYDSIGRPLPGRKMIVVTRQRDFSAPEVTTAHSVEAAIDLARNDEEAFVIGGAALYGAALDRVDRIYLTQVHAAIDGDTFFPDIDLSRWRLVEKSERAATEKDDYAYSFLVYDRA